MAPENFRRGQSRTRQTKGNTKMTDETERKLKMDMYAECRSGTASMLAGITGGEVNDTCDGVSKALAMVFSRGDATEKAHAVLAASKWMWAALEQEETEKLVAFEHVLSAERHPVVK